MKPDLSADAAVYSGPAASEDGFLDDHFHRVDHFSG
jgi:hypothetical protein